MEPEKPDELVMLAYAGGDALAFEILVRRHRTPVFNFILRFTGDRSRAEDVLQDTWLRVVTGAREYKATARFTTWLYTVARNLCVDRARKDKRRLTDPLDAPRSQRGADRDAPSLADSLADPGASPDLAAHNARLRPLLEQALLFLPEEQREVFLLREYSGIAFKEIAVVTGVSENTAKSRMRYALEGLRKGLEALGVDEEPAVERTVAG